jgi:hypothetical protein
LTFKIKDGIIKKKVFSGGFMKKILMLLLVCTLVFSLTFTMTSCDLLKSIFGGEEQPDNGGETPGGDTPDQPGVDSEDSNIFDGNVNGGNGIKLPIIDVDSTDTTLPEEGEGTEEGTEKAPDAE